MLRHVTISELLALRDGEGSAAVRSHVETCAACREELERVYQRTASLKALPTFSPPRDRWAVVRATLEGERRHARWKRAQWAVVAAAAALVGIIGVRALPIATERQDLAAREVETLVEESQELEVLLTSVQRQGRVVNGMTAAAIADLEDRIAAVDVGIERAQQVAVSPDDLADLWRERVQLMDRLVSTHARQVTYVGY